MSALRKHITSFPVLLLISTFLCSIPFAFMKVYYMYADDYLMNYIANGSYGVEYSDHLVFPRILFGTVTKFLYGITRSVNWYAVLLVATLSVSFAVFHYVITRMSENRIAFLISLVFNAVTVPMMITFTVCGFLAVAAGSLLLVCSFYRKKSLHLMVGGALLMLWGYVIRTNTFVPVVGMMLPLALQALTVLIREKDGEEKKVYVRNLMLLAATAAVSLLCLLGMRKWEQTAYGSEGWPEYNSYNDARSEVLDFPMVGYQTLGEEFRKIDLTTEQYTLLNRWSFCDKRSFPEERLLQIAAIQKNIYSHPWRLQYTKKTIKGRPNRYIIAFPFVIFLVFLIIDRRFRWFTALLEAGIFFAAILALCYIRMRFLLRVSVPLSMVSIYTVLVCTRAKESLLRGSHAAVKAARIAALAAACVLTGYVTVRFSMGFYDSVFYLRYPEIKVSAQAALDEVRSHPDRVYLAESYAFGRMYYYGHPISDVHTIDDYQHLIRSGSWDSFTPRYYRILEDLGFSDPDNLISSLLTEDNYYMITDTPEITRNYLASVTGREIRVKSEEIGDGVLKLARFSYKD